MSRFLTLAENLHPIKLRDGLIQLQVKIEKKSPLASIMDVGFGVSQILPILVADVALEKSGTLLVSQPELHLHPSAQAKLANHFISRFKSNERKYIIETHSEYLLNRFRLLVAKGEISPEEIVIYHMTPQNGSFIPIRIMILKDGRLEGAPQNYFDTYRTDVLDLAIEV
jgi:predicted ATPase